jgi:hypothetical protein
MAAVRNDDTLEEICSQLERNGGDIARACSDPMIACSTGWLKRWMRDDPRVESAIKDAIDSGTMVLESAALKRAIDGVAEPIFFKDEKVGERRRYSDGLTEFMLKARKPEVYGAKLEINKNITVKTLTDDELDKRINDISARLGLTYQPLNDPSVEDAEFTEVEEIITLDDLL